MRIFKHFPFTGRQQKWTVPAGIIGGSATFECWGAAGGMASGLHSAGKVGEVRGGDAPANRYFTNHPSRQGQLGASFSNNSGYATGTKAVNPGETYYVFVGGNGGPGHSAIKLNRSGSYSIGLRGGAGGYNGGGAGGLGAHVYQNLFNSTSTHVHYKRSTMPGSAKVNQLWWDTSVNKVKRCNATYTSGHAAASKWDTITHTHTHAVGPSGGGGGGATDIRFGGNDTSNRILVAGGAGGTGGGYIKSVSSAGWDLRKVNPSPKPPFGTDTLASGATGPDGTWCTAINYFTSGWGHGGLGGATGNSPQTTPTTSGGAASVGAGGGQATDRHTDDDAPRPKSVGGGGGTGTQGGARGAGGVGGSAGGFAVGGVGNSASGGIDDWCAGGGGGGGGYFGGGGGGQGFFVDSDDPGAYGTHAGGGGGGSNYAAPVFTQFFLGGGARPPYSSKGNGGNGLGGFARISYRMPPKVRWTSVLASVLGGSTFTASFSYAPATDGGSKIDHFIVGTGADTATFPTTQSTIMVSDHTQTAFSHDFTAPAVGSKTAIFVKVVDEDGDASDWLKQVVTGIAAGSASGATITSPASGAQILPGSTSVTWTPGTQTPEVAYRLTLSGEDLATGSAQSTRTGWRRGGSRVNLATDPGFQTNTVWSSDTNTDLVSQTTNPGISGKSGQIAWARVDDGSAENHTTTWDNLVPDKTYRLHIEIASNLANDTRQYQVQIWGESGLLTSYAFDLSAQAAGAYLPLDLEFTPTGQGVYVAILPSATSASGDDPVADLDFETATVMGFSTGTADTTHAQSGDYALKTTAASSLDLAPLLLTAGNWVLEISGYAAAAATSNPNVSLGGTGVAAISGSETVRDDWGLIRLPFSWDGVGTAVLTVSGEAAGHWWDDVTIWAADNTEDANFGNTDTGQTTYLANLLLEVRYEEDSSGYGSYFDGGHTNGNPGTAAWSGAANASPSYLTGTDATSGAITYNGPALLNGALTLETLTEETVADGYAGATTSIPVKINPSVPVTPGVALLIDHGNGRMQLTIDAADSAATVKTVSFDIFRDDQRIATGLVPDSTSRTAVFYDTPGHAQYVSYLVRAFNSDGGYTDQTDGSVTEVN